MIGPDMPARDRKLWAKEMVMACIDQFLDSEEVGEFRQDLADWSELIKQRNRVAKVLGAPERSVKK